MLADSGGPAPTAAAETSDGREDVEATGAERRMRRAIGAIRREGWKVAVIHATLDAALVTLAVNLAVSVTRPAFLPSGVPIPAMVVAGLRRWTGLALADPSLSAGAVAGVALGGLVFAVEVAVRVRRPLVEQFEAANPGLRESLRTARDALSDGRRSVIALRLYEDVVDELRRSSSIGLLDLRRVVATALLLALVSLATVQVAVVDLSIGGLDDAGGVDAPPGGDRATDYGGLQDPSGILGDPEDVPTGVENLEASVDTDGSGTGDGSESVASYADSGFAGDDVVSGQRASFAETERIEDAELIREYNLRIREEDG